MILTKIQTAEITVHAGRIVIAEDLLSWVIDGKTYPLDDKQYDILKGWLQTALVAVPEIKTISIPEYAVAVAAKVAAEPVEQIK